MISADELAKNPSKIVRFGKVRPGVCKGGCGRLTWADYCRKCRRRIAREWKQKL